VILLEECGLVNRIPAMIRTCKHLTAGVAGRGLLSRGNYFVGAS
jgi:hypothetical protein